MIDLIVLLVVVGMVLYLLQLVPMDATIRRIVHVVVIFVVILYVLKILLGISLPLHIRS